MTLLDSDTFARTVASGFGTASDGAAWTQAQGHSTSVSVGNNQGLVAYDSGARDLLTLGSQTTADGDFVGRFTPLTSSDFVGFAVRYANTSNYTRVVYYLGKFVAVASLISGVFTTYTLTSNLPYTNGQAYWIRTRFIGQTYWVKVWADGTLEPTSWLGTITNTAGPTTAGQYGVYMLSGVSGNTIAVDSLTFSDSASPAFGMDTDVGTDDLRLGVALGDAGTGSNALGGVVATLALTDAGVGALVLSLAVYGADAGVGSENLWVAVCLLLLDVGKGADGFTVNTEYLSVIFMARDGLTRLRTRDGKTSLTSRDGQSALRIR